MPPELQVKLLRVLETGRYMRVGSTTTLETDVRVIAATNRNPMQAVAGGKLREDLLYRLNVFPIELPPLRARLSDVPLLAEHFLKQVVAQEGTPRRFSPAALDHLSRYRWPGNVRELRNVVQRAYVMASGPVIDAEWLPAVDDDTAAPAAAAAAGFASASAAAEAGLFAAPLSVPGPAASAAPPAAAAGPVSVAGVPSIVLPIGTSMAEAERALILATLQHFHHHKERTAATLGVSLKTLYNRLKDYAAGGSAESEPPLG
jgi:DNA-binding NtrC family response regulator